jgi:flagellar motor switch/type III secretory pathway protein FliN
VHQGRRVRRARFEPRPSLPLSAACLVGNAVREHLGRLLGRELTVDLFEPLVPAREARALLFDAAIRYRIEGALGAVELVFRAPDARRFAAAAFHETERSEHDPLSAIEANVLERIAGELAPLCAPLCGDVRRVAAAAGTDACAVYMELRVGPPVDAVLGLALERDPDEPPGPGLRPADLDEIPLTVRAEFARGSVRLDALAALEVGAILPMETHMGATATLKAGDTIVAHGECGVREGRSAFIVRTGLATGAID